MWKRLFKRHEAPDSGAGPRDLLPAPQSLTEDELDHIRFVLFRSPVADGAARIGALNTLLHSRHPSAVPLLCRVLEHRGADLRNAMQFDRLRAQVAQWLWTFDDVRVVPALCRAPEDPELQVRLGAAKSLGKLGDPAAIPALHGVLTAAGQRGEDAELRYAVLDAITGIVERGPTAELAAIVPLLEPLADVWSPERYVYRRTLQAIRRALAQDLPVPGSAPGPAEESLPRPATPPQGNRSALPVPGPASAADNHE